MTENSDANSRHNENTDREKESRQSEITVTGGPVTPGTLVYLFGIEIIRFA